jgi:hypothetical protein
VGSSTGDLERSLKGTLELGRLSLYWSSMKGTWRIGRKGSGDGRLFP